MSTLLSILGCREEVLNDTSGYATMQISPSIRLTCTLSEPPYHMVEQKQTTHKTWQPDSLHQPSH